MFPFLIEHISKRVKQTTGIEIIIDQNQDFNLYLVNIVQSKDKLEIQSKKYIKDFSQLKSLIDKKTEVKISIDGKGILHKEVSTEDSEKNINLEEITHNALPGISVNDFFIQLCTLESNIGFLSLIRKDLFYKIQQLLIEASVIPTSITLGSYSVYSLSSFVPEGLIETNLYSIIINENRFQPTNNDKQAQSNFNNINEEPIEHAFTVAYATCLLKYNALDFIQSTFYDFEEKNKQEFYYRFISKSLFISIISTLFLILIINFLVQSNIRDSNKKLTFQYKKNEKILNDISKLKKDVNQKESFILHNKLTKNTRLTYFIDRIAEQRPNDINFQSLQVFPLTNNKYGNINFDEFENNTIYINGEGSSESVNEFLKKLRNEEWISHVDISHFENKNQSAKGSFIIIITISQ